MKINILREMTLFQFRSMMRNKIAFFFNLVMPLIFLVIFGMTYKDTASTNFLMPGELTQMLLTGGIITVAIWLSSQRQNGSMRHLFSTPLPVGLWMVTRMFATLLLTALQTAVLYAAAIGFLKVSVPSNVLGTAVVIIVASICMLAIGMVVGVFVKSPESAMPIAMILYMGMAFLGNAMMPTDNMPAFVHNVSKVMPTKFMTDALRETMMLGHGVGSVLPELAVLAGIAAVGLALAMWRLRKQFVTV